MNWQKLWRSAGFGYLALKSIERAILEALPDCEPTFFDMQVKALSFAEQNQVDVQTFGNFEIFVNGKPVLFSRAKSKEMLALSTMFRAKTYDRVLY